MKRDGRRPAWKMTDSPDPEPAIESGHSQEMLPEVYEELRRLATMRMARESQSHTLQATALVHEAWLRLTARGDHTWQNPGHFYAAAAETMRRILIDNARRKARVRHGGEYERIDLTFMDSVAETVPEENVLLIDEGLKELEKTNPKRAQIVVLKFFGGLTNSEVAQSLDMSERSVDREWACAKTWLFRWMSQARRTT
jgi:RNA polymerase sigma factor (TIGR02999 family)